MNDFLPFTRPTIDEETISGMADVLRSGWLTSGPQVQAFEAALSAYCGGRRVRVFNSGTAALEVALRLAKVGAGDTVIALGSADGWQAFFRLGDVVRPEAAAAMVALRRAGVTLSIFSGDASAAVRRVGQALDIADVRGSMTPEDKHAAVTALQATGTVVAMVGDGVNDAPVLAKAQVSIAMGSGADLARAQADIVLLGNQLAALASGVALARKTVRIVRQNLIWAFTYNLVAIPLAMAGWVTPWMAGIGMSASSLMVVLNALRLQRGR